MRDTALFRWLFYGHLWISLAATALSWLSLRLAFGQQDWAGETPLLAFIFFATLAVYTLHRYLSYRRAKGVPTAKRYQLIAEHPYLSLSVGCGAFAIACGIGIDFIGSMWPALSWALPLTVFYLTPPFPGWRRLRDLPYLKVVWVGLAWTFITVELPVSVIAKNIRNNMCDGYIPALFPGKLHLVSVHYPEVITRFFFTLTVALIFDLRDIELDKKQGVKTVANNLPKTHKILIYACTFICFYFTLSSNHYPSESNNELTLLAISYLLIIPVAHYSYSNKSEDWYATVVNGLLLLPPLVYCLLVA